MDSAQTNLKAFSALNLQERLVGDSAPMTDLRRAAAGIAVRQSTVMILGETGTGKEMLARYIHENSLRMHNQFIPVDCSSLRRYAV